MKFILILLLPLQVLSQTFPVIFHNVNIVDVVKGSVLGNRDVLVEGNKIKMVSVKLIIKKNATTINASGKFLIPGLCDFNSRPLDYENSGIPAYSVMIAYGVTSVRNHSAPQSLTEAYTIKRKIEDGKLTGPRIYLCGKRIVDRVPSRQELSNMSVVVKNEQQAGEAVDSNIRSGADVIELRRIVDPSILQAITKRAHQQQKKIVAYVSNNWIDASNYGVDAFSHTLELSRVTSKQREKYFALAARDSMRRRPMPDSEFYNNFIPSLGGVDTAYFYSLLSTLKKNHTWICTNFSDFLFSKTKFEYPDSSRYQLRTEGQNRFMVRDKQQSDESSPVQMEEQKTTLSLLVTASKKGVPLLAGTELAGFTTPGISLHDVLYWLVDAGMSPAEALKTATINPAIFLNKQNMSGTIEPGKLADMVLLKANPLENISNTKKIEAVMANGRLFSRSELDHLLEQARNKVKSKL